MGKKIKAFKTASKKMPVYLKSGFTPADTHFIKGIAILLLMWHHLCISPDNYYNGTTFPARFIVFGQSLTMWFANIGNISVTIFSFLGGYALYQCFNRPHFFTNKLLSLYKNYWKIFFIFIPIGFLFFSHQEQYSAAGYACNIFSQFDLYGVLGMFVGLTYSYNAEWWFFFVYVKAILLGMIYIHMNKKIRSYYVELGEFFFIVFLISAINGLKYKEGFEFLGNNTIVVTFFTREEVLICLLMGIVFGKYDLLPRLINWIHSLPIFTRKAITLSVLIIILFIGNHARYDFILVPVLIVSLYEIFGYVSIIKKAMSFVGKNSGNMYYMHTFLIFYFGATAKLIYKPNNSFVSFIIFVAFCLLLSVLINKFYELLYKAGCKLHLFDTINFADVEVSAPVKPPTKPAPEKQVLKEIAEEQATVEKVQIRESYHCVPDQGGNLQVASYKLPFICPECKRTLEFRKRSAICDNCKIWYVKEKYREDEELKSLAENKRIIYVKKT